MSHFYDFKATSLQGKEIELSEYKGKVVLIVNTASKCGFTYQYEGLQTLFDKYQDKGLVILGFPCNQFGQQEKGDSTEISEFCQLNYGVSFQMFDKINVNGPDCHPLYTHLKSAKRGILGTKKIKWNFTKFLVNKEGEVVSRFATATKPEAIESAIQKLL
ncbi:glutathione peroxidase [Psychrosphaera sp. B3R10]|uniref:Glutathione peroxidase n=1 Tax=Psychrosphaera algicola TaxID=3023714 RepID=A0ABT5FHX7_9GAMM|nr:MULTISPECIES: glutathione peroxidase [unclassified Psychrosphaera]MBU2880698.1 glutathione peroxidase [Psychrosphaera sp. I2R16]MBU2991556.1 glutathione peroxidase [Psychrosphaera sp. B3R10]MDC2890802.1 glutathione peroxidase [Psychrosphaera sp. G1-22]MDO6719448.1 glutathione peroxidase [Psychrosphaera sp. 1_MG-2023]